MKNLRIANENKDFLIMKEIKDFLILTSGHIFQGIILLASTRIITSLLSPAQMGRFSIIYTIAALFFSLFITPVGAYTQRKIIEWNLEGSVRYYARMYIYYLLLSGIFAAIIVLFIKHIAKIGIDISNWWIVTLVFGLIFFTYLNSFFYGVLNIFKKRLWFVICSNLTLCLGLATSLILVLLFSKSAECWISGQIIGQILVIFIGGILFYKTIKKPKGEIVYPRYISLLLNVFNFAWPISIATIILWSQTQGYRFLLKGVGGIEVLGFFTVGFNLSTRLIEKFEFLFYSFYDPIFYTNIANTNTQEKAGAWNKYAEAFFPAMILVCFFIAAGGPFIAKIFVAPNFQRIAGNIMLWGGLTSLFLAMVAVYTRVGTAKLEMKGLLGPYALGAFVALGGISILCPWNPYIGAGLSLSLGAFATLVYLMIKMHKLLPVRFPKGRVGLSLLYSLPMVAVFIILRKIISEPTIWQSITVLLVAGIYLLFAQLILAKEWILKSKIPFIETIGKKFKDFVKK